MESKRPVTRYGSRPYAGRYRPALKSSRRSITRSGALNLSNDAVTLPVEVSGTIRAPWSVK